MSLEKSDSTSDTNRLIQPNTLAAALISLNIAGCGTEVREGIATSIASDSGESSSPLNDGTFLIDVDKVAPNKCTDAKCNPQNIPLLECPEKGPLSDGPFAGLVSCGLPFERTIAICECLPVNAKVEPPIEVCWSKGKKVTTVDLVSCLGTTVFPKDETYRAESFKPLTLQCLTTGQKATGCIVNFKGPGAIELTSDELEGERVFPLHPIDAGQSNDADTNTD